MRRLWVQLALAFALVTTISILTAALLANMRAGADFRLFVARAQVQQINLIPRLTDYYAANQSWAGVETVFNDMRGMMPGGMGNGMGGGMGGAGMMRGPLELTLADATGAILYQNSAGGITRLNADELRIATPLTVNGQTAGYLLARAGHNAALSFAAQEFLDQLNQALIQAGILAGGLGLLLGLLIARGLAAPLDHLARAARRLASGDLRQRAPVAGPVEVAGAAIAFNTMAESLEQSEQQRRRMLADIAHELRTPLTVIQGNLRAILDDVYPLQKDEIATIYNESLVLGRLVTDLRELTLAEAGQLDLRRAPVNPAAIIERSSALFAAPAAEKRITLSINAPGALPPVLADADRVGQVLNNLLSNALRHTPEDGAIQVTATSETWQSNGAAQTVVRFSVYDSGPGIAPADLPYVFERFWRSDKGRARAQGGSGLGLAIARQLVLAHGGEIGVSSEPGQGARFWFTLPTDTAEVTVHT